MRSHNVYNGVLWIAECFLHAVIWTVIYLFMKEDRKYANAEICTRTYAHKRDSWIYVCVCVGTHLKHSLCTKSGNVDGDDDDDGGSGSGSGSSNNLSINQVHYSLRRICNKTATTTTSAQWSIAGACLVGLSFGRRWCSDLTSTLHTLKMQKWIVRARAVHACASAFTSTIL